MVLQPRQERRGSEGGDYFLPQAASQWHLALGGYDSLVLRSSSWTHRMNDLAQFIRSYTSADERLICFDWNEKHAEAFDDPNLAFRDPVREAVPAVVATNLASASLPVQNA